MNLTRSILVALVALPAVAHAGNDDEVLVGNDASLTGGAMGASTRDGSAIWFNPAGLALAHRLNTLDVSGSAFTLRSYSAPSLLASTDGARSGAEVLEFVSIPSALTFVRPLGKEFMVGLGLFVTKAADLSLQTNLTTMTEQANRWILATTYNRAVYNAGAAIAWRVSERCRVGASLQAVYDSQRNSSTFSGGSEGSPMNPGFITDGILSDSGLAGLRISAGVQIDLTEELHFGLTAMSPAYLLVSSFDSSQANGFFVRSADEAAGFTTRVIESVAVRYEQFLPARVRMAVAYGSRTEWISLDVDVQTSLRQPGLGIDRVTLWNARLGGKLQLWEGITAGVGVFTDRSPFRGVPVFGQQELDFYGAALGVTYESARRLAQEEDADELTFSTTIGLRYAYGSGDIGGVRVTPGIDAETVFISTRVNFEVHEVGLHVGSALYF